MNNRDHDYDAGESFISFELGTLADLGDEFFIRARGIALQEFATVVANLPEPERSVLVCEHTLAFEPESEAEMLARLELDSAYLDYVTENALRMVEHGLAVLDCLERVPPDC